MHPEAITFDNHFTVRQPEPWETRLEQQPEKRRAKAAKLHVVLLPTLERIDREDRSQAQLEIDLRTCGQ